MYSLLGQDSFLAQLIITYFFFFCFDLWNFRRVVCWCCSDWSFLCAPLAAVSCSLVTWKRPFKDTILYVLDREWCIIHLDCAGHHQSLPPFAELNRRGMLLLFFASGSIHIEIVRDALQADKQHTTTNRRCYISSSSTKCQSVSFKSTLLPSPVVVASSWAGRGV